MEDLQMKVVSRLEEKGIMKKHLAFLLGIHPYQFSNWLDNRYQLNDKQMKIIEDFLNCD